MYSVGIFKLSGDAGLSERKRAAHLTVASPFVYNANSRWTASNRLRGSYQQLSLNFVRLRSGGTGAGNLKK
jgi:hypothetical protein